MHTITTAERKLKDGRIIPKGVDVDITFVEGSSSALANVMHEGFDSAVRISLFNAHKWLRGFKSIPSEKTIEKWMDEGIALTVTGKRVEPDGIGSDGSPSWLIVMGMI